MTKAELINIVAEKCPGSSKTEVGIIYDAVFETIVKALEVEGRYQVSGFGSFEVRATKERTAINPKTKEKVQVPASRKVAFRPASQLKDKFATQK